ncbi:DUF4112 domain-containing protein [Nitrosomonas supralitoralis]|uniref:DUF4112 domain-containing protein n=1 Tax=Nitrosomonas supralitoralis TaxID=2116706 RepID=A0A2P7NX03_9PROT|nr:DUF4112 domain-containing protein [Nitrosomonas supralitoralis]PSJ17984.1 DUF4112 domain-containing protein [Nitrosomonas supralitoralis]
MNKIEIEQTKDKLNRLAWVMDNTFRIPGTQIRFGFDGLIGLIPGIGDAAGAVISSHILTQAAQMGVPKSILLKMAFNIGLDAILGIIPVLGDVSDFMWKANHRNVQLLNDYLEQPEKTVIHSRFFVGILGLIAFSGVVMISIFGFLVMRWLWLSVQGN